MSKGKKAIPRLSRADGVYYADGGCLLNGTVDAKAYGSFMMPDGKIKRLRFPNCSTNNEAEFQIVISLLRRLPEDVEAVICIDSNLVYRQVMGEWKVKNPKFAPMVRKIRHLLKSHPAVRLKWISGTEMKAALGH